MSDVGAGPSPRWRLFHAVRQGGSYLPAEPLSFGGIDDGDVDPFIDPVQRYLILSSNIRPPIGDGHEHLFVVTRDGDGWSPVRPIRYDGDSWGADDGEAQVSSAGSLLYFTSGRVVPAKQSPRARADTFLALKRMDRWDNSNSNVWALQIRQLGLGA